MQVEKIKENHVHHYRYVSKGKVYEGKGQVLEIVKKCNGTRVVLHDKVRNKTIQLYVSWITK